MEYIDTKLERNKMRESKLERHSIGVKIFLINMNIIPAYFNTLLV